MPPGANPPPKEIRRVQFSSSHSTKVVVMINNFDFSLPGRTLGSHRDFVLSLSKEMAVLPWQLQSSHLKKKGQFLELGSSFGSWLAVCYLLMSISCGIGNWIRDVG